MEILIDIENIFKFSLQGQDIHNSGQQFTYNLHGFIALKPQIEINKIDTATTEEAEKLSQYQAR
jgi:hypothetical protein